MRSSDSSTCSGLKPSFKLAVSITGILNISLAPLVSLIFDESDSNLSIRAFTKALASAPPRIYLWDSRRFISKCLERGSRFLDKLVGSRTQAVKDRQYLMFQFFSVALRSRPPVREEQIEKSCKGGLNVRLER